MTAVTGVTGSIQLTTRVGDAVFAIVLIFFVYKKNARPNKAVRQSPDLLFIATSFWFEESPSAVRTNTAGLGRLCMLFVCSTLLVFEHTHAV